MRLQLEKEKEEMTTKFSLEKLEIKKQHRSEKEALQTQFKIEKEELMN